MARTGWSTSNFLRCGSAPVTAAPLSIACWAKTSDTTHLQVLVGIRNTANDSHAFFIYLNSTSLIAATYDAGGGVEATATASPTAGVEFHACAVFSAANSRAIYLNGANKGTETSSRTPTGLNRTTIGVNDPITGPIQPFDSGGTGVLTEVAMWNGTLSDADAAALATRVHPFLVRPDKLVAYWPILGYYSPENNLKSNTATMAIQGALSQSAHTRIFNYSRGFAGHG